MSTTLIRAERPLFEGADWEFGTIQRCHDEIEKIALEEMGLDVYTNQIEVIGTEQMLDAYSSIGMPLFYKHWSFGKHFARNEAMYRAGMQGLAYEIVINSNPCISYIMEENTAMMQTLVIAHAAFGHNHFFKNNYLFQQWTDANGILDYLEFAKDYIMSCEERYGEAAVERLLDAAHALMNHAVHKYPRKRATDLRSEEKRERERREHDEKVFNDLWRTVPGKENTRQDPTAAEQRKALLRTAAGKHPVFPGKDRAQAGALAARNSPHRPHHRAVFLSAVADQGDERGLRDLRALHHHEPAARKGPADRRRDGGIPVVAHQRRVPAGIRRSPLLRHQPLCARLCHDAGHRAHLHRPDGRGPPVVPAHRRLQRPHERAARRLGELPRRKFHPAISSARSWSGSSALFHVMDDASDPNLRVEAIHDERGYRKIKQALAKHYDVSWIRADIQVVDVNLAGDRRLILHHRALNRVLLEEKDARMVLQHLADLWGYDVLMKEIDPGTDAVLKEHAASPQARDRADRADLIPSG